MSRCRPGAVFVAVMALAPYPSTPAEAPADGEPRLLSVFPSAAQRGRAFEAEARGNHLEGAYLVWADRPGVSGKVTRVQPAAAEKSQGTGDADSKNLPVFQVSLELQIDPAARPGPYSIRMVTPRGVSTAASLHVLAEPVVLEQEMKPQAVEASYRVNGRLAKPGEADLFEFQAKEGQRLRFQVTSAENFEPRLALFSSKTSWFDSARPVRMLFDEERSFDLMPIGARGVFRVAEPGRYFVEVSSLFGKGCAECSYVLSMTSDEPRDPKTPGPASWRERSFTRVLGANWVSALEQRSGRGPGAAAGELSLYSDHEGGQLIKIPALLTGTIGRPAEMDTFRFRGESGDQLAFEIETPGTPPPHFNPKLAVIDPQGRQVASNLQRRVSLFNNNAEVEGYLKDIEPKAIYTLRSAGEYSLQVRDITARYGGESFQYRILVRRQVPHAGEVAGGELDRLNLSRGGSRKVTVTAALEEGFSGDVLYTVSGLPQGVSMYPAGRVVEERAPRDLPENAETVLPVEYLSTLIFAAEPGAPLTREPARVSFNLRPVVKGRPQPELLVRELPLMVVEGVKPNEEQK